MTRPTKDFRQYLAAIGRKGAQARNRRLSAAQRRLRARKAARARWAKVKARRKKRG